MKAKNYKNEIKDMNFGIIVEGKNAGKQSYVEIPDIKEVEIDGKWVLNEGYDLAKVKEREIKSIEWQLVEQLKNKDKAGGLSIAKEIDDKIIELNAKKAVIDGL
jgi:hypothetical protein